MSNLSEQDRLALAGAGFTDREISLYRQKFYNLLNTTACVPKHRYLITREGWDRYKADSEVLDWLIARSTLCSDSRHGKWQTGIDVAPFDSKDCPEHLRKRLEGK